MESLPREILKEITKRLSLSYVASLAKTCKSFNGSIWSLISTIADDESKNIKESTRLGKFNNLQSLSFGYSATIIPQDLSKLTTLQKLYTNIAPNDLNRPGVKEYLFDAIPTLTNLRELNVCHPKFSEKLADLLADHTRLTRLSIAVQGLEQLTPLSWEIMTRLRFLRLNSPYGYNNKGPLPKGFLSTLWTMTQLRGLDLSRIILDQQQMETGLSKLTNLETLEMYACTLREEDNSEWMIDYNELLDLKKLTSLEMGVGLDFNYLQSLHHLEISSCYEVRTASHSIKAVIFHYFNMFKHAVITTQVYQNEFRQHFRLYEFNSKTQSDCA